MKKIILFFLVFGIILLIPSAFAILQAKVPYCWDGSDSNSNFTEHSSSSTKLPASINVTPSNLSANISNGQVINTTGIFPNQKKAIALSGTESYMFVDGNISKKTNILKSNNSGFCVVFNFSSLPVEGRYSIISASDQWDNADNRVLRWGIEKVGVNNYKIYIDAQLATSPDTRTIAETAGNIVDQGNDSYVCFGGNGTDYIAYVNGQLKPVTITDTPYVWLNHTTNNFQSLVFGAAHDFTQRFRDNLDGWISQVFFWNTTMTPEDFNAVYNSSRPLDCRTILGQNVSASDNFPQLNMSLNDTSLGQNDGVNVSANLSDDIGLSFCQIIHNQTGANQYFNYSLSGTGDKCSQNFTIGIANGGIINFTVRVNDTLNQFNQTSEIITIADTSPPTIINFSLQRQPIMNTTQTNIFSIFCEDVSSFLDRINFTLRFNQTTRNMTRFLRLTSGGIGGFGEGGSGIQLNTKSYIWNYTLFQSDETATEGFYNITNVGCTDRSLNYATNDSGNKLVGYDFLMDTPPTINARSPSDATTIKSNTGVILNVTITETNPSFMILYINGIKNQTVSYVGDGTTLNAFEGMNLSDLTPFNWSVSINTTFGTWTNSTNFTFRVDTTVSSDGGSVGAGGGGGGGGGCPTGFTKDEKTGDCVNITKLIKSSRNLSLIPSSNIDTFFIFTTFKIKPLSIAETSNTKNFVEWRYLLKANKIINECIITGNFECKVIQKSDILITSKQKNPKYLSKVEKGTIKIIDIDGQVSFRQVVVRMVHISYSLPFLPFKGSFIVVMIITTGLIYKYRKRFNPINLWIRFRRMLRGLYP